MKPRLHLTALLVVLMHYAAAQVIVYPIVLIGASAMPEHGFLPGKKFQFYPTIDSFNFTSLKLRVELHDTRQQLNLTRVGCSDIEMTNTPEFKNPATIYKVQEYWERLLKKAGATLDTTSTDVVNINLEGIDARLIGFGSIRAHGLCQMTVTYRGVTKTYCIDITDEDRHSPVSSKALITRKTATRIIASAAIREVIEKFFVDLKSYQ